MTSILTNSAAMAALQTLRSIDNNLETTQARVSSGLRVETASDNAAYWSIATTMRSDNRAISTVADALGLGAAKVDTAYTSLENVIDVMSEIKAKLVAAREPGVDKSKINDEIKELKNQLVSAAQSASFWPVYKKFETELAAIGDQRYAAIKDYAAHYGSLTDARATELSDKALALEEQRLALVKRYAGEFRKVLPPVKVARWVQTEMALNKIVDLRVAAEVPLAM